MTETTSISTLKKQGLVSYVMNAATLAFGNNAKLLQSKASRGIEITGAVIAGAAACCRQFFQATSMKAGLALRPSNVHLTKAQYGAFGSLMPMWFHLPGAVKE